MTRRAGGRRAAAGPRHPARGFTLLEALFTMAVLAVLSGMTLPALSAGVDRARATAAARYLAQQCGIARFHAVGRSRFVALQFTPAGEDYGIQLFADSNRNGVRSSEIADGTDRPLSEPQRLSGAFGGARIGLDPAIGLGVDPIRLSGSSLLSFSPAGTATAGTVYVLGRDGTQLAVRVLGVTGRARVLRYERATASWEQP